MDRRIDDIVVSHMLKHRKQFGDYVDVDEYETFRKALTSSYIRRVERSKPSSPVRKKVDAEETA